MNSWFSRALLPWYREHHRPLPWRKTADPYKVWLSEVILQQTRVDQGMAYWKRFVERYPTVKDLAAAKEDAVLKLWQGLGYYSRARNLLTAARQVVNDHGGRFPRKHADLLKLKGVGDYTASAIASICFDEPDAVVDGNVYRVLARVFGLDLPIDSTEGKKRFKQLAQELLDPAHPGDHNQAVMELGAIVCTPKNPACLLCPLQAKCIAFKTGRIAELPVKEGVAKTRDRFFNYLHIRTPKGLYLQQRIAKDIWQGLWELPLIESKKPLTKAGLMGAMGQMGRMGWTSDSPISAIPAHSIPLAMGAMGPMGWAVLSRSKEVKHILSHQIIHAVFWEVVPPKNYSVPKAWRDVSAKRIEKVAVPRLIERWLETV